MRTVHLAAGLLAPIPLALGLLSARFRADVARLERWTDTDVAWLRARDRRSGRIPVDRFNAGQKLNAALTIGAIVVLLGHRDRDGRLALVVADRCAHRRDVGARLDRVRPHRCRGRAHRVRAALPHGDASDSTLDVEN